VDGSGCPRIRERDIAHDGFGLIDKDDPDWTAASGFIVRGEEGLIRYVGEEKLAVKVTGAQIGGKLGPLEGTVAPNSDGTPHIHDN
jgi:hypothetical protein